MIRAATIDDLPAILRLGLEMHDQSGWSHLPVRRDDWERAAVFMLHSDAHIALVVGEPVGGMIFGVVESMWFNQHIKCGREIVWYVSPPARGGTAELIRRFEEACEERGATHGAVMLGVSSIGQKSIEKHEGAVRRLYARRGYKPVAINFARAS